MGRVVVVGAGVIGLCCAYSLRKRGHDVVVLERGRPGDGASHGNAGWIVPALSDPLPAPGLTSTSLRWLLRPDSPLYIRPRPDPAFLRWLWTFRRRCNAHDFSRGLEALAALNRHTLALFDAMVADGVECEMHRRGLLFLFMSEREAEEEVALLRAMARFGYAPPQQLDRDALRRELPFLRESVVAGLLAPDERHVRPDSLITGLVRRLEALGVEVLPSTAVQTLILPAADRVALRTSRGIVDGSYAVLAAGIWSGRLAAALGARLPLQAGKGYSITMSPSPLPIARPLYLGHTRVAVSPLEGAVRLAGTMELSGLNHRLDRRRVDALTRAVRDYLVGWEPTRVEEVWVGMRPLTPDGLPILGPLPGAPRVIVATGHAMLGVTLAPATGEAVADLVTGAADKERLAPFRSDRFLARRRACD